MTDRAHSEVLGRLFVALQVDRVSEGGNRVKAGADFADGLLFIVGHPDCRLPGGIREAAVDLANLISERAVAHRPKRRGTAFSPVDGLRYAKQPAPVYCAVVRHRREPDSYGWLRVAVIEFALAGLVRDVAPRSPSYRSPLSAGDCEVLQRLLYEPLLETGGEALYELVQAIGTQLSERGGEPAEELRIPEEALAEVALGEREKIEQALRNAYAHVVGAARTRHEPVRASAVRKPRPPRPASPAGPLADPTGTFEVPEPVAELRRQDPEAPPIAEFVDTPMLAFAPTPADVAVDEGEDESHEAPDPSIAKAASGRREARNRYALYLSGSLQPEVQRTLTPPEFRKVMGYSSNLCAQQVEASPHDAAPWMILLLSGLTSRHHLTSQYAMGDWLRTGTDEVGEFRISEQGFWSRTPIAPEPNRKSDRAAPPIIFLPWPAPVGALLRRIAASPQAWIELLDSDLSNSIHEASQTIRNQIDARFSLLRLRNSLAPAVYVGTGDETLAQIVTGDAMHHSDAPLHYYSHKVGRMRRAFAWALGSWLPSDWKWVVPAASDDDDVFGMPRARLADAEIHHAISELAGRADQPPPPRADVEDLCEAHQRMTAYVAGMFAACTTHRFTEHLRQLTRRHLLLRWTGADFGLAIFIDKYTVNALSCRGAAMAAMLVRQLEIYFAHLDRLRQRLEKNPHRNRIAIVALAAAVEGRGPLFLQLEHDEKERGTTRVRPFEASDLQRLWPEWRWPAYVLRHRFASFHWRHFGITRDDVMRQMGHASDGVAFDEGDPDSVLRFVSRMAGPLNRALDNEGWRLVRSWMPERLEVPATAPDSCAATLAEQASLTAAHARLQREATASTMGKFRVVERAGGSIPESNRATIIETARDLARAGLETWMQLPEQAQIVAAKSMSVDDVSRLTDAMTASLPDRRYWVPALNVLRNRLQRLRTDAGWTLEIPPAVFVLDVAEPVITPSCARAFIHCAELLRRSEQAILQCGLDPKLDRERWLAITAVQLAVRCGVTLTERLIPVLANAPSARRHPLLPDTLLVPIDEPVPEAVDEAVDDADQGAIESAAQYVTVQGLAAICLQRWASISGNVDREALRQELARAIHALASEGPSPDPGGLLEDFSRTVELARRLTMPGPRVAWEAGRLASRTLSMDRQIDAWQGVIRLQVETDEVLASGPDDDRRVDHSVPTAAFLEATRLCIGIREGERGQPRSAATVAGELALLATQHGPLAPTARWIQQYLLSRLRNIRSRRGRATLYQDYTNFLTPFLLELGDLELADLSSLEQTELFERVLSNRVTDDRRALKVILGIIREMNREGVDGPDRHALESAVGTAPKVAKAYLVSAVENRWICGQLASWLDGVRGRERPPNVLPFDVEAARVVWDLQFWIGLRTSENMHLRHAEVIEIDGEWILQIRRIRRRGMKTSASVRPLRLHHFLSTEAFERFKGFVAIQRAAFAGKDRAIGLFVPPSGEERVASTRGITSVLSAAMRSILPPGEGRPYAGRHSRASYGLHMVLPEEHRSAAWKLEGAPGLPAYLAQLPLRFLLRFWSRAMGHAVVRSSLEYYAHSLADLNRLDQGWPAPTLALLGCAGGMKPMTLGSKASRARIAVDERDRIVGLMLDERRGQDEAPSGDAPDFQPISGWALGRDEARYPLARLADVAREWLRGDRLSILQHRHGIGAPFLFRFVRALEGLDHQYRARIVDRRVPLDGIDSRHLLATRAAPDRRGPRRRLLLELAEAYDDLQARRPAVWRQVCAAIAEQRSGLDGIDPEGIDPPALAELQTLFKSTGLRLAGPQNIEAPSQHLVAVADDGSARLAELGLVHLIVLARSTSSAGIS